MTFFVLGAVIAGFPLEANFSCISLGCSSNGSKQRIPYGSPTSYCCWIETKGGCSWWLVLLPLTILSVLSVFPSTLSKISKWVCWLSFFSNDCGTTVLLSGDRIIEQGIGLAPGALFRAISKAFSTKPSDVLGKSYSKKWFKPWQMQPPPGPPTPPYGRTKATSASSTLSGNCC